MREWLKRVRKEKGLTQEEVASRAFINRAFYSQIENGSRNPSYDVARNIANVLKFNSSAFFTDTLSEPFQLALKNSPMVIAHCDLNLRYTWLYNPHPDFSAEHSIGKTDDELASNKGTMELMELKREVIKKGEPIKRQICFPLTSGEHCYFVFGEPLYDENKKIIGVVTASMDISDIT